MNLEFKATDEGMRAEEIRISHSIDMIIKMPQVSTHHKCIKEFESSFSDIMGVGYVAVNLRHQLYNIEL
jgi:adenylate cyclase class IV